MTQKKMKKILQKKIKSQKVLSLTIKSNKKQNKFKMKKNKPTMIFSYLKRMDVQYRPIQYQAVKIKVKLNKK